MAKYSPPPDLELQVATRLAAPAVTRLAQIAADAARVAAPGEKHWVNAGDERVRPEHRYVPPVPENLRFTLKSPDWEIRHDGVPPKQMADAPRDPALSAGLRKDCRCVLSTQASAIAGHIQAHQALPGGRQVTARVTCEAELCVTAEFGTAQDQGARYMHLGLIEARARIRPHG